MSSADSEFSTSDSEFSTANSESSTANSEPSTANPEFSRLHGIIIGIDKYKHNMHGDLLGCVNDAKSMLEYFTRDLGVPSDQFRCLFNEKATRNSIVDAFCSHLVNNSAIQRFDPIVIYFAGHGAQCHAFGGWQSGHLDEQIETLVTYDADTMDAHDEYNFGLPDRQLGVLLYHLSQAKGNNITVILDSCHSGGGTRGDKVLVRSSQVQDRPPMSPSIYERKIRESLPDDPTSLQRPTTLNKSSRRLLVPCLETHVLLAACRNDEVAQEAERRGVFTSALLESLRACNPSATGYSTLMRSVLENASCRRLPATKGDKPKHDPQTPQCEGRNQERLLFSTRISSAKGKLALMPTENPGVFQIEAGNAIGIVVGTEFGAFSDSWGFTSVPIAQLIATDVGPTGALLELQKDSKSPSELPADAYVAVIKYNNQSSTVRILVCKKSTLPEPWPEVFSILESYPVIWTKPEEPSDLVLVPTADGVELQRNTFSLEQPGPAHIHLSHKLGADRLVTILTAVIRFHFHLQHQNPKAPIQAQLGMKLQELEETGHKRWGTPEYRPKEKDFFEGFLGKGTVSSVHADAKKLFGLTLTNHSEHGLFPYVLYYNLEDYSVSCLYDPPSRSMKAPLPAGGSLSIGYGTGGSDAFNVELTNPTSEREYGMFVLLTFSEWVDIAFLQQESPFDATDNGVRVGNGLSEDRFSQSSVWDKIAVRVSILP